MKYKAIRLYKMQLRFVVLCGAPYGSWLIVVVSDNNVKQISHEINFEVLRF